MLNTINKQKYKILKESLDIFEKLLEWGSIFKIDNYAK